MRTLVPSTSVNHGSIGSLGQKWVKITSLKISAKPENWVLSNELKTGENCQNFFAWFYKVFGPKLCHISTDPACFRTMRAWTPPDGALKISAWLIHRARTSSSGAEPPTGSDFTFCTHVIICVRTCFFNTSALLVRSLPDKKRCHHLPGSA